MFRKAMFILFPIAATAFSVAVQADCVGANGQSRSGKYEYYSINPKTTDYEHYVRTTLGPVTVQVNVQGSYNNRGDCPASKDNLYFSVHWTKRRDAYGCLDPSNRGSWLILELLFQGQATWTRRPSWQVVRSDHKSRCLHGGLQTGMLERQTAAITI